MTIEEFEKEIQEAASNAQDLVLNKFIAGIHGNHLSGVKDCSCSYCEQLYEYVRAKVSYKQLKYLDWKYGDLELRLAVAKRSFLSANWTHKFFGRMTVPTKFETG